MNWQAWATEITFVKVKHYLKKAQYTCRASTEPKLRSRTEARLQFRSVPESNLIMGTWDSTTQRQWERRLKSEFAFFSVFIPFMRTHLLCQMKANPPRVEFFGTKSKFRKRKFRRCLFTSSIEREIRHFHVVVVQKRAKKCTKSVMHEQRCCFACKTYCFFDDLIAVRAVDLKVPGPVA